MQGICFQWFYDKKYSSLEFYMSICRLTFGFKKRYAYLKQENFGMNPKTLKKHRDYLVSIGVLEWEKTSGYTMYKILEPASEIYRFKLNGESKSLGSKEIKKISMEDIDKIQREGKEINLGDGW